MRILFFDFPPKNQPPVVVRQLNGWLADEIHQNPLAEPQDVFEITPEGPVGGKQENLVAAQAICRHIQMMRVAMQWIQRQR